MNKNEMEFPWLWWIMSFIFLFISFVLLHAYYIGPPFESVLSIVVTLYLLACTWAFPNIQKELNPIIEDIYTHAWSFLLTQGMYLVFWFAAPFLYMYFKFFHKK